MKEKLYTIPVNDAFDEDSECPLCSMYKALEIEAIDFTMGPSYMEDDIREATSRLGFCEKHMVKMYDKQNRLGLALILKTQMDKVAKDIERLSQSGAKITTVSLFKRKTDNSGVVEHLNALEDSCFVCDKINNTFDRYVATIFHLYHHEEAFRNKFKASKGFCIKHYRMLYDAAPNHLNGEELNDFLINTNTLFLENMRRVSDDLEWFINKFDYRYADEPWKNAKDALPRAMQKTNSII